MWSTLLKRAVFYLPVKYFAKCCTRTNDVKSELTGYDPNIPVVYVMQSNSISDLLTLEKLTKRNGLPNPFSRLEIGGEDFPRTAYMKKVNWFFNNNVCDYHFEKIFARWISHCQLNNTQLQIIPVTIVWSRNPGHENETCRDDVNKPMTAFKKFFRLMFFGYDNMTVCSGPIQLKRLITHPNKQHDTSTILARACRLHFERRYKDIIGPRLPNRAALINELLESPNIEAAINEVMRETGKNHTEIKNQAYQMLDEIVSNISYHLIRCLGAILHLVWNKLYQGLSVHGAERVRELIHSGHEIVYIPCHRSHMDYLLTSYVFTKEGLVVPHVVAGNNLNFFPISKFLRKCGAFFMRRKFKGDKLYTAVFREYLSTLFMKGYSTEFYIEGGRSRTGRTLPPRTGIVAMAVQTQLRGIERPITFIPMYLGYEKVMEVNAYMDELEGAKKEKESAWNLLNIYKRFRYYGRGYVTFGEPITLPTFLREHVPNWRNSIQENGLARPEWLHDTVNLLSDEIIMNLNASAAVNGLNLSALALLSVGKHKLSLKKLAEVINFYLMLLKNSNLNIALPEIPGSVMVKQAMELHPFHVIKQQDEEVASPSAKQIIYLTYFRNNILHFFALPALIATIIFVHKSINYEDVVTHTRNVFYFLRHELYCPIREDILNDSIKNYLKVLQLHEYIICSQGLYSLNPAKREHLFILSECIHLNLIRYLIGVEVIMSHDDKTLNEASFIELAIKRGRELPADITDNSPEFAEPTVFRVMYATLLRHNYITLDDDSDMFTKNELKLMKLVNAVGPLLPVHKIATLKTN